MLIAGLWWDMWRRCTVWTLQTTGRLKRSKKLGLGWSASVWSHLLHSELNVTRHQIFFSGGQNRDKRTVNSDLCQFLLSVYFVDWWSMGLRHEATTQPNVKREIQTYIDHLRVSVKMEMWLTAVSKGLPFSPRCVWKLDKYCLASFSDLYTQASMDFVCTTVIIVIFYKSPFQLRPVHSQAKTLTSPEKACPFSRCSEPWPSSLPKCSRISSRRWLYVIGPPEMLTRCSLSNRRETWRPVLYIVPPTWERTHEADFRHELSLSFGI